MASSREQQLMDKIRQLLPDSKKKYTWADIEKVANGWEEEIDSEDVAFRRTNYKI